MVSCADKLIWIAHTFSTLWLVVLVPKHLELGGPIHEGEHNPMLVGFFLARSLFLKTGIWPTPRMLVGFVTNSTLILRSYQPLVQVAFAAGLAPNRRNLLGASQSRPAVVPEMDVRLATE